MLQFIIRSRAKLRQAQKYFFEFAGQALDKARITCNIGIGYAASIAPNTYYTDFTGYATGAESSSPGRLAGGLLRASLHLAGGLHIG